MKQITFVRSRRLQSGASMVEFAAICFVFMAIIGFFFELSIAYFHYQLLAATTTAAARKVAVDVEGGTSCSGLEGVDDTVGNPNLAASKAKDYLTSTFGLDPAIGDCVRFCGDVLMRTDGLQEICYIRIRGRWPIKCFFCLYYRGNWFMTAEGDAYIEDECFNCDSAIAACTDTNTLCTTTPSNADFAREVGSWSYPSVGLPSSCFR